MNDVRFRGVYGYFVDNALVYVGSSCLGLAKLEHNHRNWKKLYGEQGRTNFRYHLVENYDYSDGEFRWLISPQERTQKEVETLEGQLIRSLKPELNIDKDPVRSSIKYGRYDATN